jgi:exodeoxyribonuclease V alpha subunit
MQQIGLKRGPSMIDQKRRRFRTLVFRVIVIGINLLHHAAARMKSAQRQDDALGKLKNSITAILEHALKQGHTCLAANDVANALCSVQINITGQAVLRAIEQGRLGNDIVCRNNTVSLPQAAHAEEAIAQQLQHIGQRLRTIDPLHIADWIGAERARLNDEQYAAVCVLTNSPVSILTGAPGTGKTSTIKTLAMVLERAGYRVYLTAPTGRAAARLTEATGKPALTLHRLLNRNPQHQQLRGLNSSKFREAIIVDEASMLDLFLAERLVGFCTSRTKLIFAGDVHQLPPVGPGQVFHNLIESRKIPVAELRRTFRQSEVSGITAAAKQIKAGVAPDLPSPDEKKSDCYFIAADNVLAIQRLIVNAATRSLPNRCGADPHRDIQVLTPMHKGPLGTIRLNDLIRSALNKNSDAGAPQSTPVFQPKDRVLQNRNNYDLGVFNGECGVVESVLSEAMAVRFGERSVAYFDHLYTELTYAFAITIHRSQGSEYPFVIIPVHESHSAMLTRELLYTAMTRGKQMVVFIGTRSAFGRAILNAQTYRQTGLKMLLSSPPHTQ